jgi:hypothetical protein
MGRDHRRTVCLRRPKTIWGETTGAQSVSGGPKLDLEVENTETGRDIRWGNPDLDT